MSVIQDFLKEGIQTGIDHRIRSTNVRTEWGCETLLGDSIIRVSDHLFLYAVGSRIVLYDIHAEKNVPSKHLFPQYPGVQSIVCMALSKDSKYLAVSVRLENKSSHAIMLIYNISEVRNFQGHPKMIHYTEGKALPLQFSFLSFSHDSKFIAAVPQPSSKKTILIYDWARDVIYQQIPCVSPVRQVTFNPNDVERLCCIGNGGLCQFWRVTHRTVHSAPVVGLKVKFNFTVMHWLSEDIVIIGTACGRIIVVLKSQLQTIMEGFAKDESIERDAIRPSEIQRNNALAMRYMRDPEDEDEEEDIIEDAYQSVVSIISRNEIVLIASGDGRMMVCHTKHTDASAGVSATITLIPICTIELLRHGVVPVDRKNCIATKFSADGASAEDNVLNQVVPTVPTNVVTNIVRVNAITASWCVSSVKSLNFDVIVASNTSLQVYDLRFITDPKRINDAVTSWQQGSTPKFAKSFLYDTDKDGDYNCLLSPMNAGAQTHMIDDVLLYAKTILMTYHSGRITHLSLCNRLTLFMSFSTYDDTLRLWDYNVPAGPGIMVENFREKLDESPNCVDMHPSGRSLIFGCESEVKEYLITESKCECSRKVNIKLAVTTPSGDPYSNTQAVSIVKYSHGGHLLAVVTGRLVQIFATYSLSYKNSSDKDGGTLERVMAMADHSTSITDIAFSPDDTMLITASTDGSVYEWYINSGSSSNNGTSAFSRIGDYTWKGAIASKVIVSQSLKSTPTTEKSSAVGTAMGSIATSTASSIPITRTTSKLDENGDNPANSELKKLRTTIILAIYELDPVAMQRKINKTRMGENSSTMHDRFRTGMFSGDGGSTMTSPTPELGDLPNLTRTKSHRDQTTKRLNKTTSVRGMQSGNEISLQHISAGIADSNVSYIVVWEDRVNANGQIIEVQGKVSCCAMGCIHGSDSLNICVLGFIDGRIVICPYPLPTQSSMHCEVSATITNIPPSVATNDDFVMTTEDMMMLMNGQSERHMLNLKLCKVHHLHNLRVSHVAISQSGYWIISASDSGAIYMLATNNRVGLKYITKSGVEVSGKPSTSEHDFRSSILSHGNGAIGGHGLSEATLYFDNVPEFYGGDNQMVMTDRSVLMAQSGRIEDLLLAVDDIKVGSSRALTQLTDKKNQVIAELEATLKREVKKRDDIILHGREELKQTQLKFKTEISNLNVEHSHNVTEMEIQFEKRITKEQRSYSELKQYLDEFAVHARLDLEQANVANVHKETALKQQHYNVLNQNEQQKASLLMYVDYVKDRFKEIIANLEQSQDEERVRLKEEMEARLAAIEDTKSKNTNEVLLLRRNISALKQNVNDKETLLLAKERELDWAKDRITKLESALNTVTNELQIRTENADRWEFKAGEQQQQISELERIRKALTSQLHEVRSHIVPKDEKIVQITQQLNEMDREYEGSLTAVSDKELMLKQKSAKIEVLQKQVVQLRYSLSLKDSALRRAAKHYKIYSKAMKESSAEYRKKVSLSDDHVNVSKALLAAPLSKETPGTAGGPRDEGKSAHQMTQKIGSKSLQQLTMPFRGKDSYAIAEAPDLGAKSAESLAELIVCSKDMRLSMELLQDVLAPYMNDLPTKYDEVTSTMRPGSASEINVDEGQEESDIPEDAADLFQTKQNHQISVLQKNISGLKAHVDVVNAISSNKVANYMSDNKFLLSEINALRQELKNMTLEKKKLSSELAHERALALRNAAVNGNMFDGIGVAPEASRTSLTLSDPGSLDTDSVHGGLSELPSNSVYTTMSQASHSESSGMKEADFIPSGALREGKFLKQSATTTALNHAKKQKKGFVKKIQKETTLSSAALEALHSGFSKSVEIQMPRTSQEFSEQSRLTGDALKAATPIPAPIQTAVSAAAGPLSDNSDSDDDGSLGRGSRKADMLIDALMSENAALIKKSNDSKRHEAGGESAQDILRKYAPSYEYTMNSDSYMDNRTRDTASCKTNVDNMDSSRSPKVRRIPNTVMNEAIRFPEVSQKSSGSGPSASASTNALRNSGWKRNK